MFHWLFVLCFISAYATADGERWRMLHVTLGYTLVGLLAFRAVYGLVGPRQVRLSHLWRKLAGLPGWLRSLQPGGITRVNWRQGQHLQMALAVAALMAGVVPVASTAGGPIWCGATTAGWPCCCWQPYWRSDPGSGSGSRAPAGCWPTVLRACRARGRTTSTTIDACSMRGHRVQVR